MKKIARASLRSVVPVLLAVFLASCAWDNSPPPFNTVIKYDPIRAHTFVSNNPPTNAPSTRDWKTNQVAGVGYGSSSASPANSSAAEAAGAASSPSGISTGSGAGTAGAGGVTAGSGAAAGVATPGSIIGTSPNAGPTSSSLNSSAGTSPSIGTGLRPVTPLGTGTLPTTPPLNTFGGTGITNTGSGRIFTNTLTGPTNLLPGFSRPTP
jgi:hypothetical protein